MTGFLRARILCLAVLAGTARGQGPTPTAIILPAGTVGTAYSVQLSVTGGTPPIVWAISAGSLPPGISLTSDGAITGTPTKAGAYLFTVKLTDVNGQTGAGDFIININPAGLAIIGGDTLAGGTAGAAYSQAITATGGTPPYTFSVSSGSLPGGLALDPATGLITGTPVAGGTFTFTVIVVDNAGQRAARSFSLAIAAAPLTVASTVPSAVAGVGYSVNLNASGGFPPYSFAVQAGTLPPGLTLKANGSISGSPTTAGVFTFTIQVTDASGATVTQRLSISVTLPPAPSLNVSGAPDTADAAQQLKLEAALASGYPLPITGQMVLAFAPDAAVPADDPAIQFSTGGRTVNFTIPANSTDAVFSAPVVGLQTGTVAGTITLSVRLQAGGTNIDPSPIFTRSIKINRAPPVIRSVTVTHTATGFELHVIGFSTSRELTQATFRFTPTATSDLQTTSLTVPLGDAARIWYQSTASSPFGGQFLLIQPFTIQGAANAISSISVSLTNQQGASQPVTVTY